ncbi:MAG: imidazoleglycerol-phosphate dehydratase HisB [Phycisphaerae bacterium]|jgi:imidazoleglycerol-phosphate dehydratase|nr:imidazoleglycerol-phosphate dehydratase HisB [Phycisphaerae bacterium]
MAKSEKRKRVAEVSRKTRETDISVKVDLDGAGVTEVATGVGFLDHMLTLLGRHALIDITVSAKGDLRVDPHHTVEDVGICLGQALAEALGEKRGIVRFGSASLPMDEALALVSLDLSARPYLVFNAEFVGEKVGEFDTELVQEFLQALATHAGMTLHVSVPYGVNNHHIAEAIFKSLARALREAVAIDDRESGTPSTKGVL